MVQQVEWIDNDRQMDTVDRQAGRHGPIESRSRRRQLETDGWVDRHTEYALRPGCCHPPLRTVIETYFQNRSSLATPFSIALLSSGLLLACW